MEDYQTRVIQEQADLQDKIDNLVRFTESDSFLHLSREYRNMLLCQLDLMRGYSNILLRRIDIFRSL